MTRLPLTPVERYFYHDHRGSHPAWIRCEFTFRGALERAAFARAWDGIDRLHPLTGAIVAERAWGGPVWVTKATRPELVWRESTAPVDADGTDDLHDLSGRAGLRGVVQQCGAETQLTLHMHHAVADGLGLMLIAEDLLALFARECGAVIPLPALGSLRARRNGGPMPVAQWPWLAIGVVWGLVLGRQRVVELRGADTSGRGERRALVVAPELTSGMRATARAARVSLNELLIRDVQAALGSWLQRYGGPTPEDWTRLLVPVNVGGRRGDERISTNAIGVAPIDCRVKTLGRRGRLLERAKEDMTFVRRRGLMRAFGATMWLRCWLPGAIGRHCRRKGARGTLFFSNLGKIFCNGPLVRADGVLVVPGAELTGFTGWGPCRPGTAGFVLMAEYRGALSVGLACDPGALGAAHADCLAGALIVEFRRSAAGE
jgi:hypothetical protein